MAKVAHIGASVLRLTLLIGASGCFGKASSGPGADDAPNEMPEAPLPSAGAGSMAPGLGSEPWGEHGFSPYQPSLAASAALLVDDCGAVGHLIDGASLHGIAEPALADAIASGDIVPGSSATSPLVQRLTARALSGEASGCPTLGAVALLSQFVDGLGPAPAAPCIAAPRLGFEQQYAAVADDIEHVPEAERPFMRYVTLAALSNAGLCGERLDRYRAALVYAINAVSLAPEVRSPRAVNEGLTYRIDLRDYAWDRPLDVDADGAPDAADAWAAIVGAAGPYAVEWRGAAADRVKRWTGSAVPLLPSSVFITSALLPDTYYALLGMGSSLLGYARELGVDIERGLRGDGDASAEFGTAAVRQRVTRFEQESGRSVWMLQDVPTAAGAAPGSFDGGGFMFELPNGLFGFGAAGADGARSAEIPATIGGTLGPAVAGTIAVGCLDCHSSGLLPIRADGGDDLTPWLERADRGYAAALSSLGLGRGGADVTRAFLDFTYGPLTLHVAAAELGVSRDSLRAVTREVPSLERFEAVEGIIDRMTFSPAYLDALCVLHGYDETRPVACDERRRYFAPVEPPSGLNRR